MNITKRKLIGLCLIGAAGLAALALQVFGGGLVVVSTLHPATPPDLAARGIDIAGGQNVDWSRAISLTILAVAGLVYLVWPNRNDKPLV